MTEGEAVRGPVPWYPPKVASDQEASAMTAHRIPLSELEQGIPFEQRHIGPDHEAQAKMLAQVGYGSLDELIAAAVPDVIKSTAALALPAARTEAEVLTELRSLADRNQVLDSMIGLGYYGTFTPPVILRNVMENPAWYTAYTPYQPEISQGRLEALLNFQTMVADLTGLPTAGASLLDEGTAAAEAMALSRRMGKNKKGLFLVDADTFPQTVAVIRTRASSASTAPAAPRSCQKPSSPLPRTMVRMIAASVCWPRKDAIEAAKSRIKTMGLLNWPRRSEAVPASLRGRRTLPPSRARRARASA